MKIIKLLQLLRIFGAGLTITLIDHLAQHTRNVFGLTPTTFGFLLPIAIFYALLYVIKFFGLHTERLTRQDNKKITRKVHFTQIILLILTLLLAIMELIEKRTPTAKDYAEMGLTVVFILVTDYIFGIITDIFKDLYK